MSWPMAPIEAIASVKGGKRLPKGHDFSPVPTDHPYIRARDIGDNRITFAEPVYVTDHTFSRIKNYTVSEGDVVVTIVGANIGDIGFITGDFEGANLTENAARLCVNKALCDPKFLSLQLSSPRAKVKFQLLTGGSAQGKLGLYKINAFDVLLPPLQIQSRIASILSAYDDLIENNRRRIELLEQAARLLYKEWFVHLRFPGHEHVTITDGVPEGWEKKTVPAVVEINPKETVPKGTPIRYVSMSGLSTTGMTVDLRDAEVRTKSTSIRYRNGDTLFARITPCLENGKTGFVNFLRKGEVACGSTEFIVLRGRSVSPYFTYCLARTHNFREKAIKSMIGSSGRQRVQPSCFANIVVARPPRFLRDEFDCVCEPLFSQIAGLMSQLQSLTQARDLLLPRLMSGEIA